MTTKLLRPAVLVALGAVVAAALTPLFADGGAARPASWWAWAAVPAAAMAIGVLAAAVGRNRRGFVTVAVLGLAGAGLAGWLFVADLRTGTPGGILVVLAMCALVVTGAMVAGAVGPVRAEQRDPRPDAQSHRPTAWVPALLPVTAALVVGAGLLVAPAARTLPQQSSTAAPSPVPDLPEFPQKQVWSTESTASRSFFNRGGVVAAGAGFVTAQGYPGAPAPGLAGVDGATGELRWTYRLGRATPAGLVASPDGAFVVAVFVPRTTSTAKANRLVVLDAQTGEPLWSRVVDRIFDNAYLAPTTTTLPLFAGDLVARGDSGTLLGIDLSTGEVRWSRSAPPGCHWVFTIAASTATASLQSARCDDGTARLIALDQQTGDQQWTYTTDVRGLGATRENWGFDDMIDTDPAGTVVRLIRRISGVDERIAVVLDARDGSVSASIDSGYPQTPGPVAVVERSDHLQVLPAGAATVIDLPACVSSYPVATTKTAAIQACRTGPAGERRWQLRSTPVANSTGSVTLGTMNERPSAIVVAPGAVITVIVDDDRVRYLAFR